MAKRVKAVDNLARKSKREKANGKSTGSNEIILYEQEVEKWHLEQPKPSQASPTFFT